MSAIVDKYPKLLLAGILILYLVLAVACARTLMPWADEEWFAGPALNLMTKGYMGTPVLDPTASWNTRDLTLVDRYTYWIMPLYPFSETLWFQIVPFGLFDSRMYSVCWGLAALLAWFAVMWKLSGDGRVALLTVALLAIDFTFTWSAAVGRMDMMCAALGMSGIAIFLWYREKNFALAVFVSHAFLAAAGLAHPTALGALAALVALTVYYDRSRIRFSHVLLAAVPYLAGAACWGAYIAKNPALFWTQFKGDVSNRVLAGPLLEWLRMQTVERYLYMFGMAPDTRGLSHIKIALLAIYVLGLAGAFSMRRIRDRQGYRALLLLWAASTFTIAAVDKEIHHFYLLHFVMPLAAILAVWICCSWDSRAVPRWALAGILGAFVTVQLAVVSSRIMQDPYHKSYLASTEFLKGRTHPGDMIFGSGELAFQLGFDGQVVDDYRLGFRTGKRASFIVLDHNRYQEFIANLEKTEPETYKYIQDMLRQQFQLVHSDNGYLIYARKI
jgi:hypothetical protein